MIAITTSNSTSVKPLGLRIGRGVGMEGLVVGGTGSNNQQRTTPIRIMQTHDSPAHHSVLRRFVHDLAKFLKSALQKARDGERAAVHVLGDLSEGPIVEVLEDDG